MLESSDTLLTVANLAQYLQLGEKTILRMLKNQEIPGVKIGNQWRFSRQVIDDWILSKMQVVPKNDLSKLMETSPDLIPLSRLVEPAHVLLTIPPGPKEEILYRLIRPLVEEGFITDPAEYVELLKNREDMMPTAIGPVAFPHIRNPHANEAAGPHVVVGICRKGTDFGAPNGEPTRLFLMPYSDSQIVHLRIMAKLASLFRDDKNVDALMAAETGEQVIGILIGLEHEYK